MELLRNSEETLMHLVNHALPEYGYLSKLLVEDAPEQYDDYCDFAEVFKSSVIAPYCTPCANGVPIVSEAAKMARFKIPYTKLCDVVTLCRILETYMVVDGGIVKRKFSPRDDLQRINLSTFSIANAHKHAIGMLKEKMAFDFFAYGTGDYRSAYANGQVIDFGRDNILKNVIFGPQNKWNYPNGSILNSILGAKNLLKRKFFNLRHIICNSETMYHLITHRELRDAKNNCCDQKIKDSVANVPSPYFFDASSFTLGNVSGITFHSYDECERKLDFSSGAVDYVLGDKFLPDGMAIFVGQSGQGPTADIPVRMFHGQIKSLSAIRAGESNQKIHTKVWQTEDMEKVITQSAPMVAGNANCAFMVNVLI